MPIVSECQRARWLMLKAMLDEILVLVMKDGLRADTVVVHHLVNAKLRLEDLLDGKEMASTQKV